MQYRAFLVEGQFLLCFLKGEEYMAFRGLKKFSRTKQSDETVAVVLDGQMSMDDYMRQTFGCDATSSEDLPTDEPSLSVVFDDNEV